MGRCVASPRPPVRHDAGISIIEVLVAALIFMIISIGVTQATVTSVRLAGDQSHRVTALSLAASEIDAVRSVLDPFDVNTPAPRVVTVDGTDYTITRDTSWVSAAAPTSPAAAAAPRISSSSASTCASPGPANWPRPSRCRRTPCSPRSAASTTRALGTIMISAKKADGTGAAGVTASVTPVSGGAVALGAAAAGHRHERLHLRTPGHAGRLHRHAHRAQYIDITQSATPTQTRNRRGRIDGLCAVRL